MMLGGGLMMGIGLLVLLAIIVIPVLLVIALVGGTAGFMRKKNDVMVGSQPMANNTSSTFIQSAEASAPPTRFCSHCGAGLQASWSHCPQCGAPIG